MDWQVYCSECSTGHFKFAHNLSVYLKITRQIEIITTIFKIVENGTNERNIHKMRYDHQQYKRRKKRIQQNLQT